MSGYRIVSSRTLGERERHERPRADLRLAVLDGGRMDGHSRHHAYVVQIVGKIRMAHVPLLKHWWQVTLYVSPRGLTTGAISYRDAVFDMEFDLVNEILAIRKSDGRQETVTLAAKPVAEFYGETLSALDRLDIETPSWANPTR